MAMWRKDGTDEYVDDGLRFKPEEPGFTDVIAAEFFKIKDADGAVIGQHSFTYAGTPNWEAPVVLELPKLDHVCAPPA